MTDEGQSFYIFVQSQTFVHDHLESGLQHEKLSILGELLSMFLKGLGLFAWIVVWYFLGMFQDSKKFITCLSVSSFLTLMCGNNLLS